MQHASRHQLLAFPDDRIPCRQVLLLIGEPQLWEATVGGSFLSPEIATNKIFRWKHVVDLMVHTLHPIILLRSRELCEQ